MKKFVTSLRQPAAAATAVAPAKKGRAGKRNEWFLTAASESTSVSSRDRVYPFGYKYLLLLLCTSQRRYNDTVNKISATAGTSRFEASNTWK